MAKSSFYSGSQQASANSNAVEDSKNAAALSEAAAAASAAASATSAASASGSATTATTKASESASSATSSATSASASQASRVASEAAKVASETAKTAAENARDAAAASSTSASSSQAAASASETNSASSAAAALVSENASAASETAASASASAASTSETNAASSETAAAASETAAAASETAAATSETNAATSETNAATSETNASTSASSASTSASNAATSATSASNAQTAAEAARDATLTAYDNFDDRYLGAKSSAPTVDNDGNALVAGALYFDSTAGAMKVYTGSSWVAAYVSGTDYLPFSGGTMTGDVGHGDGVKATFGASQDLQVYHSGTNSLIQDLGTGILQLASNGSEIKLSVAGGDNMARFFTGGESQLFCNGGLKLATKTSGINVTGTVVADGLTVDGDATVQGASGATLTLKSTSTSLTTNDLLGQVDFYNNDFSGDGPSVQARISATTPNTIGNGSVLQFFTTNAGTGTEGSDPISRMQINHLGDISFYEDTGTTPKFFWDASNESLGIGMSTPSSTFAVDAIKPFRISASSPNVNFVETDVSNQSWAAGSYGGTFAVRDITGSGYPLQIEAGTANNTLYLDSNNRVGIGTSSPSEELTIRASVPKIQIEDSDGTNQYGQFYHSAGITAIQARNGNTDGTIVFQKYDGTTTDETVRIDSSGNLEMTGGGSVGWANFTFKEESGYLYVYNGSTKIMRVDASGNAAFAGDVEANATL